ncbi:MAG: PDZ domain-containing protein [Allomuricauda sp.]
MGLEAQNGQVVASYEISLDLDKPHLLQVQMKVQLKSAEFLMSSGADHLPKGWATFIDDFTAEDAKGNPLAVKERKNGTWKIKEGENQWVDINYTYRLEHMNQQWSGGVDGVAYSTDWGNFYAGRTLFVFQDGQHGPVDLKFNIPPHWKITHPWVNVKGNEVLYRAKDVEDLSQSMFFIGTHEEMTFEREGFELVFALGGDEVISNRDSYGRLAEGVLDYYVKLFEGLPKPPANRNFKKSVVIINDADFTDGEVIGNNISILVTKGGDATSKMLANFIFAHEFFHLWNGKSFMPEDLKTEWFKEGFSNFYTLKALRQMNILDDESFFEILDSLFYQRYRNDDGLGDVAMVEGDRKHDHWGLIYAGGLFTAISQDAIIRRNTENRHSVDDLMKEFYAAYSGTSKTYGLKEIKENLSRLSGQNQSSFFDKYIQGTEMIPLELYMAELALEPEIRDGGLIVHVPAEVSPMEAEMIQGFLGKLKERE